MVFISNKYTKWYNSIIINAQARPVIFEYNEKHHIIPKSLGGTNDHNNLVALTAREHFVCHWLLTKMVNGKRPTYQMWNALSSMMYWHKTDSNREKISSRKFAILKEQIALQKSIHFRGKNNTMYGKKHTDITREKMKASHAARFDSHSKSAKEYAATEDPIKKAERYRKSKESQQGIAKPRFTCPHCGRSIGSHGNFARHTKICKSNPLNS